jgi:hypothetical protein
MDDAQTYASKFCAEKMDKSTLEFLDRTVLKEMGVSEGDIIRILKGKESFFKDKDTASNLKNSSSHVSSSSGTHQKHQHHQQHSQLHNHKKTENKGKVTGDLDQIFGNSRNDRNQILSDEALARKLQEEEMRAAAAAKSGNSNPAQSSSHKGHSKNTGKSTGLPPGGIPIAPMQPLQPTPVSRPNAAISRKQSGNIN